MTLGSWNNVTENKKKNIGCDYFMPCQAFLTGVFIESYIGCMKKDFTYCFSALIFARSLITDMYTRPGGLVFIVELPRDLANLDA